jgi:hypothetical protein
VCGIFTPTSQETVVMIVILFGEHTQREVARRRQHPNTRTDTLCVCVCITGEAIVRCVFAVIAEFIVNRCVWGVFAAVCKNSTNYRTHVLLLWLSFAHPECGAQHGRTNWPSVATLRLEVCVCFCNMRSATKEKHGVASVHFPNAIVHTKSRIAALPKPTFL